MYEYDDKDLNEAGLPERRIKDASSAWTICQKLISDDSVAAQDRAIIDGMIDGKAPYEQKDLDEAGQSERININPKDASALEEQATRAYYDLLTSVDILATIECVYGDNIQRPEWAVVISEEYTTTLRAWNLLNLRVANLHTQYVRHGVSMSFFEDEIDWRFRTCGLADFKVYRNTPAAEDECDLAMIRVPLTVMKLYAFIKHEETAGEDGWAVDDVKAIVLKHCNLVQTQNKGIPYQNWEWLERQIKENDISFGSSDYHIWINHLFVKEFDDTITHIIVPQDENKCTDFLYENRSRYGNIHKAFTIFTYGIGDGTYHTIRGMAWKIFDQEQAYARLWNTAMDGAMGAAVTMLQPTTGANVDLTKCALSFNGPFAIIPGGYQVVNQPIRDHSKTVGPIIAELKSQIRNNTITYQGGSAMPDADKMPVKNFAHLAEQEMALTESALDLWYAPWGRLLTEVFTRMQYRDLGPECPGYKEVNEMKKRILARGVPLEAFYTARNLKPVRAVGSGSKVARLSAFDQAIALAGSSTEEGRYNLIRDRSALTLGKDAIERYFPKEKLEGAQKFNQDTKNAEFENGFFRSFIAGPVSTSDNHSIHCATHAGIIQAVMETAQEGGEPNLEDLEYKFKFLSTALPHFEEHNNILAQDPSRKGESKMYARLIQQAAASSKRAQDTMKAHVEAQQAAEEAEQQRQVEAEQAHIAELEKKVAESEGGGDNNGAAKLQREIMAHEHKIRMKEDDFKQNQKHRSAELAQKLAFRDADNAMKMLSLAKVNPYEA